MSDRTATGMQRCACGHPSYTDQAHKNHLAACVRIITVANVIRYQTTGTDGVQREFDNKTQALAALGVR